MVYGLVPPERILILTNVEQEEAVRALLPEFPPGNNVAEPAKRDTAAAVAPQILDSDTTTVVLPGVRKSATNLLARLLKKGR